MAAPPDLDSPAVGVRDRLRLALSGSIAIDSMALITTSVLTAVTGIVFWTVVARLIPPHELGVQTALLSLMTTAGTVAASGPGNALTAMIPATPARHRRMLLRRALVTVVVTAGVCGMVAAALGASTIDGPPPAAAVALVLTGAFVMAFFALKDTVLTALSSARRLPALNMAAAVVKIGLVPVLVMITFPQTAVIATLGSSVLAITVAVVLIRRSMELEVPAERFVRDHDGRQLVGFALRDGSASLISMGPLLGAPFLTTWLAGPVQGAILALMLPISQGLDYVTIGTATALTKHLPTAANPARMVARIWAITQAAVLGVAVLVLFAFSPVLFRFFGHDYDHTVLWTTLALLCVGSIARVPFVTWAAMLRATLATRTLLVTNLSMSALSVPVLVICTDRWGAQGAAAGLAVGSALLGVVGALQLIANRRRARRDAASSETEVLR
ncbi:hypothetical protein AAFP35_16060 [Gordonia sp. CPCC 206044]|uniref:lipopolysaccharide biosynthesis protein n=1 Tax=Gordonia sp. CPCC 206044 TaxID=3140793 RepID=UPI003AF38234